MGASLPPFNGNARFAPNGSTIIRPISKSTQPIFYNFKPNALRKIRAALRDVELGVANARIMCVGDSTDRGRDYGVTDVQQYQSAVAMHMAAIFTNRYGIAASANNIFGLGGNITLSSFDDRATNGWGASTASTLGGKMFSGTSGTLSFSPGVACDTFEIFSPQNSGLGTFTVNLDGGSTLATVNQAAGSADLIKTTVTGTLGTHTLNLVRSSGTVYVTGINAYNSANKQVFIYNMGNSGATAEDLVTTGNTNPWNPINAFAKYDPHLTTLNFGINEWTQSLTVSSYYTNLLAVATAAKNAGDVIIRTPLPSDTTTASMATQQQYVEAAYAVANTLDLPLIDVWSYFGDYTTSNSFGLYSDTRHASKKGYRDVATLVSRAIFD